MFSGASKCLHCAAMLWHNTFRNPSSVLAACDMMTSFLVSTTRKLIDINVPATVVWFPKVTLHLNIYDSLPVVVFVTIVVTYLVLPLNMYMQMVQNVCF